MKKLLLTACAACALGAFAQSDDTAPKALYLVGSFQETPWLTPDMGGTDLAITDADGDGIYTGEFEIAEGTCEFKIFSSPDADWSATDSYYGTLTQYPMYEGIPYEVSMLTSDNGGYNNFGVTNWAGGTLTVSVNWNTRTLSLSGTNQPAPLDIADTLWIIGDFNSWGIPTDGNANGAIKFPSGVKNLSGISFEGDLEVPADTHEFMLYSTTAVGNPIYWGTDYPAFQLSTYHKPDGVKTPSGLYMDLIESETAESAKHIRIVDWKGGKIHFSSSMGWNNSLDLYLCSNDAPISKFDNKPFYSITSTNGESELNTFTPNANFMNVYTQAYGRNCKITLTDEESLTPAPENCYGLADDVNLQQDLDGNNGKGRYTLVKGGKPFEYSFKGKGYLSVTVDLGTGIVTVEQKLIEISYEDLEEIYLVGTPQNWEITDGSIVLKAAEPGVFTGTVAMENNPSFRFFHKLGQWTSDNCFGAALGDWTEISTPVTDEEWTVSDIVDHSLGNWAIPDWAFGDMQIKVDLVNMKLYLKGNGHAGVESVETDPESTQAQYFNLQGLRTEPTVPGLYIVRKGTKTEKVMVR